ncbi:MAG: metal-dependent hydrolase [Verrucomicrobiota bacterium]
MSPETHLLASWIIAAKTTRNPRDCRLVTLAGILPDADGLGLISDLVSAKWFPKHQTFFYMEYHHYLLHGLVGGLLIAGILAAFAVDRWRVLLLALLVFHLHLLCDLAGSRGPSPQDLWPIYYWGPWTRHGAVGWRGQWPLDAWQNRYFTVALFLWALWLPIRLGYSVVGVFSPRADAVFVGVLRNWHSRISQAIHHYQRPTLPK